MSFIKHFYLKVFAVLILCCFSIENFAAPLLMQQSGGKEKIMSGTSVVVGLKDDWSSSIQNNCPDFFVINDVQDKDGNILIAKNTPVQSVCNVVKPRGLGKPGTITVRFVSTTAVDGTNVPLEGKAYGEGRDKFGLALGLGLGLGLFVIWGFGFFFLCLKGGKATLDDTFTKTVSTTGVIFVTPTPQTN